MPLENSVTRAFRLEGDGWLRHADPWSVDTRMPIAALGVAGGAPRAVLGPDVRQRRGLPFVIWGVVIDDPRMTLFGLAVHITGKIWFIDRMALLYDAMNLTGSESPPPPG